MKNDNKIEWKSNINETIENLITLIQAKTVNPPGDEKIAIMRIKEILDQSGFPKEQYRILEATNNRFNLVARIPGDGSKRPLLLSGHVDVVPVEPEYWSHDPFGGEIVDGYIWGRGAVDMKSAVAMYLQIFLMAFRNKLPLKRDLIFAAIADEEAGFEYGSKFLVKNYKELIDAEYGLTETGGLTLYMGGKKIYPIQIAEKGYAWLKVVANGKPGHGSMPHLDNSVYFMSEALYRLKKAGHLPYHITEPYEAMIGALRKQLPSLTGIGIGLLRSPLILNLLMKQLTQEASQLLMALVTNTVSPTILKAGKKANVIPSSTEGQFDCRLLPGQSPEDVMREILSITGDKISLEVISSSSGAQFPVNTAVYRILEKRILDMDPDGAVIPFMIPGATDASVYQQLGIKVYGFTPGILPEDYPYMEMPHGHNERIPVKTIETGVKALWETVNEICV